LQSYKKGETAVVIATFETSRETQSNRWVRVQLKREKT